MDTGVLLTAFMIYGQWWSAGATLGAIRDLPWRLGNDPSSYYFDRKRLAVADPALHIFSRLVDITGACLSGLVEVITSWEGLGHLLSPLALASLGIGSFVFIFFLYIAIMAPNSTSSSKEVGTCSFFSHLCQFALLKIGALKVVFSFYYKIVCWQFDQIEALFGTRGLWEPGAWASHVGDLVTVWEAWWLK